MDNARLRPSQSSTRNCRTSGASAVPWFGIHQQRQITEPRADACGPDRRIRQGQDNQILAANTAMEADRGRQKSRFEAALL